jgi:glycosyltransferase involved in cell wall biosynthesis
VLTPHSEGVEKRWDDGGVEVVSFRYAPERWEVLGYSRSLSSDERIRLGSALVTPLYALAGTAAVRSLLRERDFDLLHAHWVVPNAFLAAPAVRKLPWAIGLHGSDVFLAEKAGIRALVRGVLGRARLLTGCSPELVDRVCALGFERNRSEVIPYGVDTDAFTSEGDQGDWRQRLGIPAGAPVILSVGRMVTKKGYQILLEALPQLLGEHPTAHVVLGGTGDRLEEFRVRASLISDRVHFPGIVLRDSLPALYRAADIFVLPAVHDRKGNVDGLPNVILEAMASGLPVVASAISGIPLAIESGVTGLLVPEGNLDALREGLGTLLTDSRQRHAMGRASRQKATRELTWAVVAGRYRKAYEKALGAGAG